MYPGKKTTSLSSYFGADPSNKDISGNDKQEGQDATNTAEVIIAKNRHGSVGNVKMGWIGQFTKFRSLEEDLKEG